ncbi:MAG: site-2 protease family protein, partial [Planctomycetota bacterium]
LLGTNTAPGPIIGVSSLASFVRGLRPGPLADLLKEGDRIRKAGDLAVRRPADFFAAVWHAGSLPPLEILRDGQPLFLPGNSSLAPAGLAAQIWLGVEDPLVLSVRPGGPAWNAGMRDGDRVLRVDGIGVESFSQLASLVAPDPGADQETLPALAIDYQRRGAGDPIRVRIQPKASPRYTYGLALQVLQETVQTRTFLEGIALGFAETRLQVREVLLSIERMLTGDVSTRNLGGIITISEVTHSFAASGWIPLLFFLGTLSIYLAVFNLLPIPALDGGHLFLILVEKLRGRPLSDRAQGMFHMVGFAVVLLLIVFVTWQDIRRLITR